MDISDALSKLSVKEQKYSERTGLVFDDRVIEHRNLWDLTHPERPERYLSSLQRCNDYDLINKCLIIPSRFASETELLLIHSKAYIDLVKNTKSCDSISELEKISSTFDSIYFHPKTYDSALIAAGSTVELVSSVLNGRILNGMAIVRPPGHHAMAENACGFCYFNNVAIAAKHALENFNLKKILIIDWDVHHGQATQQVFYNDPRVLYFSIHRYEHGNYWPNLRESNFDYTGSGRAQGYNLNVPLNSTKLGNTDYLAIFNNILLPVAYEFCPELVIVSAGFDAALGCPEGEMEVTPQAYPHLLNLISNLAGGRICVILEGGYCLTSLAESVALSLRTLLHYPCPIIFPTSDVHLSTVETILNVISVQRPFWESLRIQDSYDSQNKGNDVIRKLHSVDFKFLGKPVEGPVYETRNYPMQETSTIAVYEDELQKLIEATDLSVPEHCTCLIFDARMTQHVNKREKHHPETADRVIKIYEKLKKNELLSKCLLLESRPASELELALVHDLKYINEMKTTSTMSNRDIAKLEAEYESVYLCQGTYESAILACGSLLQAVDAVVQKKCTNGFALIRPPGHHAEVREACGFCIFNSVAIAAKYLVSKYSMKKILIVDWDIHHGNGIQHIFYKDDNVLYISLHLYDGEFFPGLSEASHEAIGEAKGEGFNINIPWSTAMGDGDYLAAFFHIVLPVAYEYSPEFILISAGFDAVEGDPLGGCHVTPACFGIMTKLLSGLCNGKVVLALEGGYNLDATSEAVVHCINSLLGQNVTLPDSVKPSKSAVDSLRAVVCAHKKYWKCLCLDADVPVIQQNLTNNEPSTSLNSHDITINTSDPVTIPSEKKVEGNIDNFEIDVILNCEGAQGSSFEGQTLFCVTPLDYCPHLELLQTLPNEGLNPYAVCQACNDSNENWVCLHCYQVYCGRFISGHMLNHGTDMQHFLTLSYSDLSVWCYACESYIHNQMLMPVKQHVHIKKFGVPM